MNYQTQHIEQPVHHGPSEPVFPQPADTARHGEISIVLCLLALMLTPLLVLLPIAGFIPAVLGLVGAVVAWTGLKRAPHRRGPMVTGLIASTVVFALAASIATLWHATVIVPAITDYNDLGTAVTNAWDALFS